MILSLNSYVRKSRLTLRRWLMDPRAHSAVQAAAYALAGLLFSAAALGNYSLPLAMGLLCACAGWSAVFTFLGGCLGYLLFWGNAGFPGICWLVLCLPVSLLLNKKELTRSSPFLVPAVAALLVAASGVLFQLILADTTPIAMYLLRVLLAAASALLFSRILRQRNPILDWLATGLGVLALAQLVPLPYFGLGYLAAGFVLGAGAFPAAAMAGLALDLAQITPVPMTAVIALSYLVRFIPNYPRWLGITAPMCVYLGVMSLCGCWDLQPVPGLFLGCLLGTMIPVPGKFTHRRGETGVAQVRLEMAATVLTQTQALLLDVQAPPVDEDALMTRCVERACGACAYRKSCRDSTRLSQLPSVVFHKPLLSTDELPIICRKPGRVLAELHRGQEQLRSIRADRQRQKEYRAAVIQQYRFLSAFLQGLSDQLPRRTDTAPFSFAPEVTVYGNRQEQDNGDQCLRFSGVGKKYYVLLCDGMGTGAGAVQESKLAAELLHKMLIAGYPSEHALRSLNSLCALRDRAGAVTVDLAEIELDSGKVRLYKWGAAPSYIATKYGSERLGFASPPPGLSVTGEQELVEHTSLRRGEWLVMVSDGVSDAAALRCCSELAQQSPAELAAGILACGQLNGQDDATVVIIRLSVL